MAPKKSVPRPKDTPDIASFFKGSHQPRLSHMLRNNEERLEYHLLKADDTLNKATIHDSLSDIDNLP